MVTGEAVSATWTRDPSLRRRSRSTLKRFPAWRAVPIISPSSTWPSGRISAVSNCPVDSVAVKPNSDTNSRLVRITRPSRSSKATASGALSNSSSRSAVWRRISASKRLRGSMSVIDPAAGGRHLGGPHPHQHQHPPRGKQSAHADTQRFCPPGGKYRALGCAHHHHQGCIGDRRGRHENLGRLRGDHARRPARKTPFAADDVEHATAVGKLLAQRRFARRDARDQRPVPGHERDKAELAEIERTI